MRASKLLSKSESESVMAAIESAEATTSAEVVVCIATRSGRYDRGEDLIGVAVALLCVAGAWITFQGAHAESWGLSLNLGLLPILGIFAVGFSIGAAAATFFPALSLFFSTRAEMRSNVHDRARIAFQDLGVRGTRAATGVLIYVSLLERTVSVIGDHAITEAIEQKTWDSLRDAVIAGIAEGRPSEGLCKAIKQAGAVLATHMPGSHDDTDELGNHLRIID
jgi:putative membrane protein